RRGPSSRGLAIGSVQRPKNWRPTLTEHPSRPLYRVLGAQPESDLENSIMRPGKSEGEGSSKPAPAAQQPGDNIAPPATPQMAPHGGKREIAVRGGKREIATRGGKWERRDTFWMSRT